jgi:SAM-dependent methyltransferase
VSIFDRYARYYDVFYREKDYRAEVDYVDALIQRYATSEAKTILDLGCGTGGHAMLLAQKGYLITGVDRSAVMLAIAEEKKRQLQVAVELVEGDICTVDLFRNFDVAIAMFAVMGYQTANKTLEATLMNTRKHLNEDGLLLFDGWFGPAVLEQRPQDKMLVVEEGAGKIIRFTRPELDILSHTVNVRFSVLHIEDNNICESVEEAHTMRFFFPKELEYVLEKTGFRVLGMYPFMKTEGCLTENDWNMTVVAQSVSL